MKILITGAGGFLGKKLIHQLLSEPQFNINGKSVNVSHYYEPDCLATLLMN